MILYIVLVDERTEGGTACLPAFADLQKASAYVKDQGVNYPILALDANGENLSDESTEKT